MGQRILDVRWHHVIPAQEDKFLVRMYACTVKYDDLLARRCLISLDGTIGVVVCFPDVAVNKRGRFTETNNNRPADSGTGKEAISFEFFSTLHATRSGRPTF